MILLQLMTMMMIDWYDDDGADDDDGWCCALLPHDGGDVYYLLPALTVPAGADDDDGWCCSSAARRRCVLLTTGTDAARWLSVSGCAISVDVWWTELHCHPATPGCHFQRCQTVRCQCTNKRRWTHVLCLPCCSWLLYALEWNTGRRGSKEIGSLLYMYLKEHVPACVTHVIVTFDSTGAQFMNVSHVPCRKPFAIDNTSYLQSESQFFCSQHTCKYLTWHELQPSRSTLRLFTNCY